MHSERCLEIGHCRWRATTFARRWVNNLGWRRKLVFLLQLSCDGGKDNSRAFTRQSQITLGGMRPNLSGKNLMGLLRPKVPSFSFDKISLPVQREFIHPSLFPDKILKMAIWAVKKGHPLKDLVAVVFWQILICGKISCIWLHWRPEKIPFSFHLFSNNARGSALGRTVWTCMIYWVDLWRPLANTCGIFCAFCEFHLKATFLLPPQYMKLTSLCNAPWKLCQ